MRVAICDDDKIMLNLLCKEIKKEFSRFETDYSFVTFENGFDLLMLHEKEPFDVVFLDIDMPCIDGFEVAEKIKHHNTALIVFITSHDELVYSSFKFQPFRFIRKNHISSELPEAIKALIDTIAERTTASRFEIRTSSGKIFLDLNTVEYIEIYGHWLKIAIHNSDTIECYGSLSDFEKRLGSFHFVRTHKSFLVNCKYIYSIEQKQVILDDKTKIPLSKYKAEYVKNKLRNYLRGNI